MELLKQLETLVDLASDIVLNYNIRSNDKALKEREDEYVSMSELAQLAILEHLVNEYGLNDIVR